MISDNFLDFIWVGLDGLLHFSSQIVLVGGKVHTGKMVMEVFWEMRSN